MRIIQIILAGLVLSHTIAALQVYLSNIAHLQKLTALREAGYLTVPNSLVMETLIRWGPSFFGGLFFTLTVGLALTLIALAAAWVSSRFFPGERSFRMAALAFWAGMSVWLNQDGWVPMASAYFLLIPPVVFFLAEKRLPAPEDGRPGRAVLLHGGCILILFVMGFLMGVGGMDAGMFTRIRDRLLLTNPPGRAVNDFYYRYTLYPAQVFKSPAQDLIRAAHVSAQLSTEPAEGSNSALTRVIQRTLIRLDYLVIDTMEAADLVISQDGEALRFTHGGKTILSVSPKTFLKSPVETLKTFSRGVDRHAPFRRFTFLSLMGVAGLFIYGVLYLPGRGIAALFAKGFRASAVAAVLCVLAGFGFIMAAKPEPPAALPVSAIQDALTDPNLHSRVAALRYLHRRKIDIASFQGYRKIARSPHETERYWLARALECSRSSESYAVNMELLDDPMINVAYMAFLALGRRGNPRAIPEILRRLKTEDRWYVQLYAYKALRRLGWSQTESG